MKLLLIRHGQSVANAQGRLQGHLDSPLSELGRAQARNLARRLEREGWAASAIYTSDLLRAAETAEILSAGLSAPVEPDRRLREYDVGVLTGLVWQEIESRYPEIWHGLQHSPTWTPIPGEEGNGPFFTRLVAALTDIRSGHGHGDVVALVSHGGSLGMMLAHLLGMEPRRPTPFRFGNASLSVVEFHSRRVILSRLNDTCHIEDRLG
jgi:broad specificity phosphatase PhoE